RGTRCVPGEAATRLLPLLALAVNRARAWLAAVRPRTLSAAVVPVAVGTAAAARDGSARPAVALIALVAATLLQVGTNLVNDWGDARRGADGPDRLGPARAVVAGWLTPGEALRGAALDFGGARGLAGFLIAAGSRAVAPLCLPRPTSPPSPPP